MKILRWAGIGVVALGLGFAIVYATRTDPIAVIPGRALSGEVVLEPVADWSFSDEHMLIAVESRPAAPHSVTTIAFAHDGALYVPARGGAAKSWPHYVVSDPRVRLKIGERVYPALATRVSDPALASELIAAARAKYDLPGGDGQALEDVWLFRMESPPADVAAGPKATRKSDASGAGKSDEERLAAALRIVAQKDRSEEDRQKDLTRKPAELLAFARVEPGMRVADLGAGAGYTTELLVRAVGKEGFVVGQNPPSVIERFVSKTWPARLAKPVNARVKRIDSEWTDPLPGVGDLDLITVVYFYHDWLYQVEDRAKLNRTLYEALAPGGSLVIVDHKAKPGAGPEAGETVHRIDEALLRRDLLDAGFRLADEADFLARPEDPRDQAFFRMDGKPTDTLVHRYVRPVTK